MFHAATIGSRRRVPIRGRGRTGESKGNRMEGRGNVGRETFELASALIGEGKRPTEAFALVAERTGRSAATVATAYYRVARTIPGGAGVQQRARSGPRAAAPAPVATRHGGTTTSELVRQLVDAAAALAQHVERLERENAEHRQITDALERLQRNR
jgi:hypothetical protein